jgi:hypothetical protein
MAHAATGETNPATVSFARKGRPLKWGETPPVWLMPEHHRML